MRFAQTNEEVEVSVPPAGRDDMDPVLSRTADGIKPLAVNASEALRNLGIVQMRMKLLAAIEPALLILTLPSMVPAEVRPNSLFADNAVFQRGKELPIWGTARERERVTVEFAGQSVSTIARDGKWKVLLKPMNANATPQTMTITGDNTIILSNILIGDVWVASGQSNMKRQLGPRPPQKPIENWEAEVAAADCPQIREYYVPEHLAPAPADDANGQWNRCSPQTVSEFSAVGYLFARDIQRAERVPIGILFTAWGGTVAEAWTSADSLKTMADFKSALGTPPSGRQ